MKYFLHGPYPFDVDSVAPSTRVALSEVAAALRTGEADSLLDPAITAREPGLYLAITTDPEPCLAGFWVVFGTSYLEEGTLGPPDKFPPYIEGLLTAATEEVWWKNLKVSGKNPGLWRPFVVLEWMSILAFRSRLSPPGVPQVSSDGDGGEKAKADEEAWLEQANASGSEESLPVMVSFDEAFSSPYANLPNNRSLVLVAQGHLSYSSSVHQGSFRIVHPDMLDAVATDDGVIPFETWLDFAATVDLPDEHTGERHRLGRPMAALDNRVVFSLSGWLTKSLDMWPVQPKDIKVGFLTDRVVEVPWKAQARRALSSMVAVLALVIGITVLVQIATEPRPRPVKTPQAPAAQPAMSVCSAENQRFVEELRCQISNLSNTPYEDLGEAVCSDPGSLTGLHPVPGDLRAEYCGLMDRELDGFGGSLLGPGGAGTYNFADLAASQACFNVLGHPYKYAIGTGSTRVQSRAMADPDRFLRDPALSYSSLVELSKDLKDICTMYRQRSELRVEGAIFATHIGEPLMEGWEREAEESALRRGFMDIALVGVSDEGKRCFREGMQSGLDVTSYDRMCGEPDKKDRKINEKKIWQKLASPEMQDIIALGVDAPVAPLAAPLVAVAPPRAESNPVVDAVSSLLTQRSDLISRYVWARYDLGSRKPMTLSKTDPQWQCHLTLTGTLPQQAQAIVPGLWDLEFPVPNRYDIRGIGIKTQLILDSALRAFQGGTDGGVCWNVVAKRVSGYTPVHPLLAELDPIGWPSPEQQLCGQICATIYQVKTSPNGSAWMTPSADLGTCLTVQAPGAQPDLGRGTLDRLRLPWNGIEATGWIKPTAAQICSFNLIAQGYYPATESFIVGGKAPQQWSGETVSGSRIAGGSEGLASKSVDGMGRYGTGSSWSIGACGHVAIQCFTSIMMDIMGDAKGHERYEWMDTWVQRVESLSSARRSELVLENPWCVPVQPYLSVERELAQFDAPCRRGVEQARKNVEYAIQTLSTELPTQK